MTITILYYKSVESMIITVISISGYNCNIDIYHNIYPIVQKGSNQFVSHFKARWDEHYSYTNHTNSLVVISNFNAIIFEHHQFLFQLNQLFYTMIVIVWSLGCRRTDILDETTPTPWRSGFVPACREILLVSDRFWFRTPFVPILLSQLKRHCSGKISM